MGLGKRTPHFPLVVPPMGLLYLAAYVREALPVDVRVFNQRLENTPVDCLMDDFRSFEPDLVGLSSMTTSAYELPEAVRTAREAFPRALVVVGGAHATAVRERVLEECAADAAVVGPGELTLQRILEVRADGGSLAEVPGLIWRDPDGQIVANPGSAETVTDLDLLPRPAYDLIDLPKYWRRQSIIAVPDRRYVSLFSSRGCPYRCAYCHKIFGRKFVSHPVERVVDDIEFFLRQYNVDEFEFLDDIFNVNPDHVMDFCSLLTKRGVRARYAFPNGLRGDLLTEESIEALVDTGMYYVNIPLETASVRLQATMGKQLDVERWQQNAERLERRGAFVYTCAVLGLPTETLAEMHATVDAMCDSPAHAGSIFTLTPFPGAPAYDMAMKMRPDLMETLQYDDVDLSSFSVNLSTVPDEVVLRIQRRGTRRFLMRPRRILRLIKAYPKPFSLPIYLPIALRKATKGLWRRSDASAGVTSRESPSE